MKIQRIHLIRRVTDVEGLNVSYGQAGDSIRESHAHASNTREKLEHTQAAFLWAGDSVVVVIVIVVVGCWKGLDTMFI